MRCSVRMLAVVIGLMMAFETHANEIAAEPRVKPPPEPNVQPEQLDPFSAYRKVFGYSKGRYIDVRSAPDMPHAKQDKGTEKRHRLTASTLRQITSFLFHPDNQSDRNMLRNIQHALSDLGFYRGRTDGEVSPDIKKAISDFQQAAGLPVTGKPSYTLLADIRFYRQ